MPQADHSKNDRELAEWLYEEWDNGAGTSKSALELEVWGDASSHGKRFDRLVGTELGVSTTKRSKQTNRILALEEQIRGLGAHPDGTEVETWQDSVLHSRKSMIEALRVWNDPATAFRSSAFSLLFVTAWNALSIAIIERVGGVWWDLSSPAGERSLSTPELIEQAIPGPENASVRRNVNFWVELRNCVAHRYLPAVDPSVIPWAQAGLLNFEAVLASEFGSAYSLADSLSVPLQLSGFRDPGVLASRKKLQAGLPLDVQAVLADAQSAADEFPGDPKYMLRVAFVPFVPASGNGVDAVAHFFRPEDVPEDLEEMLQRYVVLQKANSGSRANLKPTVVAEEVQRRTGFRFNTTDHAVVGRKLGVRPRSGEPERTLKIEFAEYSAAFSRYAYTAAWVEYLVEELSDEARFLELTGKSPTRVSGCG